MRLVAACCSAVHAVRDLSWANVSFLRRWTRAAELPPAGVVGPAVLVQQAGDVLDELIGTADHSLSTIETVADTLAGDGPDVAETPAAVTTTTSTTRRRLGLPVGTGPEPAAVPTAAAPRPRAEAP